MVLATVVVSATAMISTGLPATPAGATACEGRVLVTDAGDSGLPGQLRQAVARVCDGGTVQLRVAEPIVLDEPVHVDKTLRASGDGATIDARAGAFTVTATGALRLSQLTLTNTTDSPAIGIQVRGGTAVLDDVTVTAFNRHGIWLGAGSVVVVGGTSAITGNVIPADVPPPTSGFSTLHGAGIFSHGGSITLKEAATVSDNTVVANSPGNIPGTPIPIPHFARGGGITLWGGLLTLQDDASITGNAAAPRPGHPGDHTGGGGIYMGTASIDGNLQRALVVLKGRASITGNTARQGAGIMNLDSDVVLRDGSTVADNAAGQAGGGIWTHTTWSHSPSTVTLYDSATITGNTAPAGTGGGVHHSYAGLVVRYDDATVSGNSLPDVFGGTVVP